MLKLELHKPVKWLRHGQSLKMVHLTIFSLIGAGLVKDTVGLDSRKPPKRNLQNQPAPGKGVLKFCISNRGEVGEVKIITIRETEQREGN